MLMKSRPSGYITWPRISGRCEMAWTVSVNESEVGSSGGVISHANKAARIGVIRSVHGKEFHVSSMIVYARIGVIRTSR